LPTSQVTEAHAPRPTSAQPHPRRRWACAGVSAAERVRGGEPLCRPPAAAPLPTPAVDASGGTCNLRLRAWLCLQFPARARAIAARANFRRAAAAPQRSRDFNFPAGDPQGATARTSQVGRQGPINRPRPVARRSGPHNSRLKFGWVRPDFAIQVALSCCGVPPALVMAPFPSAQTRLKPNPI